MKSMLMKQPFDIVAITESKRSDDHPVSELHHNYKWIGKNRSANGGGGIGFLLNNKTVPITDANLLNSQDDDVERLWIAIRIANTPIAIGITYFPQDNIKACEDSATELHNELIQNVAELETVYDNILLLGDFNGKVSQFKPPGQKSSNGNLVENIQNTTNMINLNVDDKCEGKITWQRGALSSTIDYALCSNKLYEVIRGVKVDEEQSYSIGSDHNFMVIDIEIPAPHSSNRKGMQSEKMLRNGTLRIKPTGRHSRSHHEICLWVGMHNHSQVLMIYGQISKNAYLKQENNRLDTNNTTTKRSSGTRKLLN